MNLWKEPSLKLSRVKISNYVNSRWPQSIAHRILGFMSNGVRYTSSLNVIAASRHEYVEDMTSPETRCALCFKNSVDSRHRY